MTGLLKVIKSNRLAATLLLLIVLNPEVALASVVKPDHTQRFDDLYGQYVVVVLLNTYEDSAHLLGPEPQYEAALKETFDAHKELIDQLVNYINHGPSYESGPVTRKQIFSELLGRYIARKIIEQSKTTKTEYIDDGYRLEPRVQETYSYDEAHIQSAFIFASALIKKLTPQLNPYKNIARPSPEMFSTWAVASIHLAVTFSLYEKGALYDLSSYLMQSESPIHVLSAFTLAVLAQSYRTHSQAVQSHFIKGMLTELELPSSKKINKAFTAAFVNINTKAVLPYLCESSLLSVKEVAARDLPRIRVVVDEVNEAYEAEQNFEESEEVNMESANIINLNANGKEL